jgi:hypothetical protein
MKVQKRLNLSFRFKTVVNMKISALWDVTLGRLLQVYRRF